MSSEAKSTSAIVIAVIAAIGSIGAAFFANNSISEISEIFGTLDSGQKVCHVLHNGANWRDNMIVPKDWEIDTCLNFAEQFDADNYSIGCVNDEGAEVSPYVRVAGDAKPEIPEPNCGWDTD